MDLLMTALRWLSLLMVVAAFLACAAGLLRKVFVTEAYWEDRTNRRLATIACGCLVGAIVTSLPLTPGLPL
ncbi:hypothetical protein AYK61_25925 [Rhodococcus sp. SBT000017]|nr:hypothetical protein AYK61_25925 [Rhodococcus sp. SBT000017]